MFFLSYLLECMSSCNHVLARFLLFTLLKHVWFCDVYEGTNHVTGLRNSKQYYITPVTVLGNIY